MRPTRKFIPLALAGVCLVAALLFFSMAPPTTRLPGPSNGAASPASNQVSSLKTIAGARASEPTTETNATDASILATATTAAATPLDDLRTRVEALAKSARTLRQRYRITDPDPENTDAKVTVDASASTLAKLESQLTQTTQVQGMTLLFSNKNDASSSPDPRTFAVLSDSASNTTGLTFTSVTNKGAIAIDAMPGATFTVSSSETDASGLLKTKSGSGILTLQALPSPDELRATMDALRHPDQATAEYQRAKAEYLAAKQQYQAANLAPLPPERVKDWRHSPSLSLPAKAP